MNTLSSKLASFISRLVDYAYHTIGCNVEDDKPCDCGLDGLLQEIIDVRKERDYD